MTPKIGVISIRLANGLQNPFPVNPIADALSVQLTLVVMTLNLSH